MLIIIDWDIDVVYVDDRIEDDADDETITKNTSHSSPEPTGLYREEGIHLWRAQ